MLVIKCYLCWFDSIFRCQCCQLGFKYQYLLHFTEVTAYYVSILHINPQKSQRENIVARLMKPTTQDK
jgi:hypothetical protein